MYTTFHFDSAADLNVFTEEFSKAIDLKLAEKLAIKKIKLAWKKSF